MSVAHVYVLYECIFSFFLELCWWYRCVDDDCQQTPLSLPFACPRAKAKMLVVDQELLQCRLHFKYARFITKFSTTIWMNWHVCSPIITLLLMELFGLLLVLGGCKTEQMNRPAYHLFFDWLYFWRFWKFCKINVVPQMIHSIAQKCMYIPHQRLLTLPFFHPTI
jgi:hypothetical protein